MIEQSMRLVENSLQHDLILQILVRNISHSSLNVEDVVNRLVDHSPEFAIPLTGCCYYGTI